MRIDWRNLVLVATTGTMVAAALATAMPQKENVAAKRKGQAAAQKATKTARTKADVPIDPEGWPESSLTKQSARYFIWHDKMGWHLRSTTAGKLRRFHGAIRLDQGRIESVISTGIDKEKTDAWRVDKDRKTLKYEFKTASRSDGFYFKVKDTTELEFDLAIDGKKDAKAVFIGKKGQHPAEVPFTLPTPMPDKQGANDPKIKSNESQ